MNQPWEVKDFHRGKTDNYLAGPIEAGQEYDNLLININRKPFTRPGSILEDSTNSQIPSGVKRISDFIYHRSTLLKQSEDHLYYISGSYTELMGPGGYSAFHGNTVSNFISKTFWNNQTYAVSDNFCKPIKIFKDGSNVLQMRTAGLPALASDPIVTMGASGTNNYIYIFHYSYTYVVEGVTFKTSGFTSQVQVLNMATPDTSSVSITGIPALVNGAGDNYDISNIKVEIYRTIANGTTAFLVTTINNGTTTYTDSASDLSIENNLTVYTTGGVVDNESPPPAKFVHTAANNITVYGNVQEDGINIPTRLRQSISEIPDSVPSSFFDDYQEQIMGISSIQGVFIVFCENSTHRLDSFFDEFGRGGLTHLRISDTVGAVSNDAIIQVDNGIVFAAKQGWYYTDGYTVTKISRHLNKTYPTLVPTTSQSRRMYGAYDRIGNRIWFSTQRSKSSTDNDSCFVLDLQWGISEESTFTTASGVTSFEPTALLFINSDLYRADTRGFVFVHDASNLTDPKVDIDQTPSNWVKQTIIHNYISCAFDFGSSSVRKFVPKVRLTLEDMSNIGVQIISNNDDGKKIQNLTEIRYTNNLVWDDPELIWGDASLLWNIQGLIDKYRWFPAGGLRCNYKQLQITNSLGVIANSDTYSQGTVDSAAKTVTLTNVLSTWPADSVDYYISFANDSYTHQFLVTARTISAITFLDPLSQSPTNGNYKWLLKGYRKNEILNILSYVIFFQTVSDAQGAFQASDTGSNS